MNTDKSKDRTALVPWDVFLSEHPPGSSAKVSGVFEHKVDGMIHPAYPKEPYPRGVSFLTTPELTLYCGSDACDGYRIFNHDETGTLIDFNDNDWHSKFFCYNCRNCQETQKIFAFLYKTIPYSEDDDYDDSVGEVIKIGEWPSFGPPVPRRALKIFEDSERKLFLKGRSAENQGMGIGALIYYRRVIVNQKNRLIDEIIKAARAAESPEEMIELLKAAREEDQFSRSIEVIGDSFPESLKIKDHNPLTLIHAALSGAIHNLSDKECLQRATSIRVLLTELAERMNQVLKNEMELKKAMTNLLPPQIEGNKKS